MSKWNEWKLQLSVYLGPFRRGGGLFKIYTFRFLVLVKIGETVSPGFRFLILIKIGETVSTGQMLRAKNCTMVLRNDPGVLCNDSGVLRNVLDVAQF